LHDIECFLGDDGRSVIVFANYHRDDPAYSCIALTREIPSEDSDAFKAQVELVREFMTMRVTVH
jgi:hypothetical protein